MITKYKATVIDGKIKLNKFLPLFKRRLKQYEGKDVYITISDKVSSRSNNQNKYYWGVVLQVLSNEIGYDPEEIHEVMKQKFLLQENIIINNNNYNVPKSTTKLNIEQFEIYLNKIRVWAAAEMGIKIPTPNEEY